MPRLYPMKLFNIVVNAALEERLVGIAEAHEPSGYTVLDARGAGLQTGVLEGEGNILFMLVVPESRLDALLAEVNKLTKRGHHQAAFVSDTKVMRREKFDG